MILEFLDLIYVHLLCLLKFLPILELICAPLMLLEIGIENLQAKSLEFFVMALIGVDSSIDNGDVGTFPL